MREKRGQKRPSSPRKCPQSLSRRTALLLKPTFSGACQAALEAPRFTKRNSGGCDLSIEVRVPAATLQQLSERGHQIRIRREYTQEMGRGQAILHDSRTGTNYAASDPRADGEAVPEPIVR